MKPLSELQQLFCDGLRSSEPPAQALLYLIRHGGGLVSLDRLLWK